MRSGHAWSMGSCPSPFLPGPGPPHIQVPGTHLSLPPWCPSSENGNGISGVRITVPPTLWHCPVVQFLRAALGPRSTPRALFRIQLDTHLSDGKQQRKETPINTGMFPALLRCFADNCPTGGRCGSTQPLIQMPRLRHRPSEGRRDSVISTGSTPLLASRSLLRLAQGLRSLLGLFIAGDLIKSSSKTTNAKQVVRKHL